jgi:tRNA threonylcarbamoyladenosine biosynthesis protein TsaB
MRQAAMCNPEREMPESQSVMERAREGVLRLLGVDTCGPTGSVALGLWASGRLEVLGQKELAGRTYSATLVSAVGELLMEAGARLDLIDAIVVVNGPGSFTGVRVGLSAVKGLAEPGQIPVVGVSRLAVLAAKAGVSSAALDAHRHEVFLRLGGPNEDAREMLAGAEEFAAIPAPGEPVAVCEETAGNLIAQAWPEANVVWSTAPTAAEAIELCLPRVLAHDFVDLALLDGHYLRRSDAEIFGGAAPPRMGKPAIRVRRMKREDLDCVMEMAAATHQAPRWPRQSYEEVLDPGAQPRRVALVAEDGQSGAIAGFAVASVMAPEAELEAIVTASAHQRRGVARELFSAIKSELRRQGVQDVILEVRAGNKAALGLYSFLGFMEEGRRPAYYAEPVEDGILMRLRIA